MTTPYAGATVEAILDFSRVDRDFGRMVEEATERAVEVAQNNLEGIVDAAGDSARRASNEMRNGFGDAERAAQETTQEVNRAFERITAEIDTRPIDAMRSQVEQLSQASQRARRAESTAAAEAAQAEENLRRAREAGNPAQIVDAEERYERAMRGSLDASRDAAAAAGRLGTAQDELRNSTRQAGDETEEAGGSADGYGDRLNELGKKAGAAAVAFAGVSSAVDLVAEAMDREAGNDLLAAQLGASPAVAKEYGEIAGRLYANGMGESMGEVNEAIGAAQSSFATLGFEGEASIDQVATRALNLSTVFGQEVPESIASAASLVRVGLAKDSTEAFDLMTTAFQRVPAAMRDELPELTNEYGTFFASLGFSGQEAFGALVNASELGAIAMDKVGDALKETGIRASDLGDKAAQEALTSLGLHADLIANDLLVGGEQGKYAFTQMTDALLGVEDPAKQAELAIALFGTPLEDLNKAEIPAFLEAMGSAGDSMVGFEGSADRMGATLSDNLAAKLESLKRTIQGGFIDALTSAGEWLMRNADTFKEIGIALAPLAAGMLLYAGYLGVVAAATKAWTIAQAAFNLVMDANPVVKIILVIGALVAAVIYAYRNFEGFRNVVDAVWQGIQAAFSAAWSFIQPILAAIGQFIMGTVVPALMSFWTDTVQPVFQQIGQIISWLWTTVVQPVFGLIVGYITNVVIPVFQFYWSIISTVFDAIGAIISFAWNNVIRPVFDFLVSLVRDTIIPLFQWFYSGVIQPVFDAIGAAISFWWNNIVQPVFNAAKAFLSDVLAPAFTWLKDSVIQPVMDGIGAVISGVWNGTIQPIWELMKSGIGLVGDAFGAAGEVIGSIWDGVMGNIKTVAKFIGGILQKVPTKIGPVEVPGGAGARTLGDSLVGWAEGHADGGFIRGAGGPTSDSILSWLSNGEFVVRAAVTRKIRPILERLNAGMDPARAFASTLGGDFRSGWGVEEDSLAARAVLGAGAAGRKILGALPGFAGGGVVSADELVDFARGVEGKPYDWGGVNWGDCSGAVSAIANKATGLDPFASRFATGNEDSELARRGFLPGLGPAGSLNVGWFNGGPYGGHTAATLPDGTNFEMGGARGDGQFGGQAAGASDPMFTDHAHLPPEAFLGGNPIPSELSGGVGDMGLDYSGGGGGLSAGGSGGSGGGAGGSSGSGSGGSGGASGSSAGATRVYVTNWPSVSPSTSSDLAASAKTAMPPSASAPAAPAGGAGTTAEAPATGIDAANKWAADQDFGKQAADWGTDAVKEIFGPLFDPLGLSGLFEQGVDTARSQLEAAQQQTGGSGGGPIADTIVFQGYDPNQIVGGIRRMLEDRLAPVTGRFRNGG